MMCCKSNKLLVEEYTYFLKDYGAMANDNIDDSKALSNLLLAVDKKPGIKKVIFEKGTYVFSQQITLISNIELIGNNTTVKPKTNGDSFIFFSGDYGSKKENIKISGITIIGNTSQRKFIAFGVKNFDKEKIYNNNITIEGCTFKNLDHCIIVNNTDSLTIYKNYFENCNNVFISLNNENINVKKNRLNTINKGLIFADEANKANKKVKIFENEIKKITSYPIHFSNVSISGTHQNILIKNNIIIGDTIPYSKKADEGSADQISIHGAKDVIITENESIGGGDMGITVTNCNDVELISNIVSYNDRSGIIISNSNNIIITSNKIFNNGQRRDNGSSAGIGLYSNTKEGNNNIIIQKNLIYDNQKNPSQLLQVEDYGPNNRFKIIEE